MKKMTGSLVRISICMSINESLTKKIVFKSDILRYKQNKLKEKSYSISEAFIINKSIN